MLLIYALVITALVGWNMWPAALLSYVRGDEQQVSQPGPVGEVPTVAAESQEEGIETLTASPAATPQIAGATVKQEAKTTVNGAEITPSPSDDCDFKYHLDTSKEGTDSDDVHVEHHCKQESENSSIDNEVNINVSTGGNSSNDNESEGTQKSGAVEVDLSIRNETR